jgi:hypothetical protein
MTDGTRAQQPGKRSIRIIALVTLVTAVVLLAAGTAAATPGVNDGVVTGAGPGTGDTASGDVPEPTPPANGQSTSSVTTMATLVVDDDGAECPSAGFTSIQSAVNSASSGDTIEVCPGTYEEKVRIDVPNLRIVGDPGDATPGPGPDAPVMDGNGSKSIAFKLLDDANNVTIEGFEAFNYINNEFLTPSGVWTSVNARGATVLDNEFRGMDIAIYNSNFSSTLEDWTIKRTVIVGNTGTSATPILLNQARDPVIVNNRVIQTTDSGFWGIYWEGPVSGSPSTAVVRDNVVDGTGNSSFFRAGIKSNHQFSASVSSGSRIVNNTVRNTTGGEGIAVENPFGGEFRDLTIARNTVRDLTGSATVLGSGVPAEEVRIKLNNFVNIGEFGVENFNTTVGTWVDATNNFWGASDGPGSPADPDAPFADPVTGALSDGAGGNVTEGATAGVSNVHFDPFATSPFGEDEQECVNRRNLGRGQTGQECPTDREISRDESRDELDRNTGRNSDTARRDRSRRDRGRSR